MLPPDGRRAARDQLVEALRPTQGMLAQISSDPVLAAGFEDPEVMAAVAEVAADPAALAKHRGNAKVMRFYAAMGGLVGGRLEEIGNSDGGSGKGGGSGGHPDKAGGRQVEAAVVPLARVAAAGGQHHQHQQQRMEVRWRE
ncbi:hypothetical protein MNEG_0998 [Monoraphidium neglectum]|jgi:hypothetical protein|uniref:STI1/HOP DP domain-containing protein n=1 Tax=Monoraphidium neglectum TaxID=145388 RepID=A0A0D2N3J5_9CHLO|nr:hypothetical protein MNEG_0998 [Monoraphidium neglectum]KIZ06947.1 hypothetical protein MNEG_0998 [Monoraphidium neglectum]|eukprot:XP_013905966.1 hypothetical protein MNEG_0998 [Monoraphidium neglectum]